MHTDSNISLQPYHFFASEEQAKYFTIIKNKEDVTDAIEWCQKHNLPLLILGSGSNVLFTKNYQGLIAKMEINGIKKINETATEVVLEVGAGENWHHFVSYCVHKGWGGLENLSLIPGTVGASPIQNIGAYGVEVHECIQHITAFDSVSKEWVLLSKQACNFGYRTSLFKENAHRYIITQVQFVLQKQPQLKTDYGAIRDMLHEKGIKHPNLESVSNAIVQIRSQKLPDPKILGNAGSFFKNPAVSKSQYEHLQEQFPAIIAYPISDDSYKIAAGWLIESCGWKGIKKGNVGCYEKQALVIVSYGIRSGQEVFDFSEEIIQSVANKFKIVLEREVNIY